MLTRAIGIFTSKVDIPLATFSALAIATDLLLHVGLWRLVVILEQHHFVEGIAVALVNVAAKVRLQLILTVFFVQLLELVCVCRPDEGSLHVVNVAIRIHEELTLVTLDLDATHDHVVVLHVDADVSLLRVWVISVRLLRTIRVIASLTALVLIGRLLIVLEAQPRLIDAVSRLNGRILRES